MKRIIIILCISLLIIGGCQSNNTATQKQTPSKEQILNKNESILLDVRTKEEYQESHIKGAQNIPYDSLNEKTKLDKEKTIFVYCQSGKRSKIAYNTLKKLGYTVYDLGAFSKIDLPKE